MVRGTDGAAADYGRLPGEASPLPRAFWTQAADGVRLRLAIWRAETTAGGAPVGDGLAHHAAGGVAGNGAGPVETRAVAAQLAAAKAAEGGRATTTPARPWAGEAAARGTVLLFPGRTEYLEKYGTIAEWLTAAGWSVISLDWRGQGASDRLLAQPRAGHVGSFADYRLDVAALVDTAVAAELPRPWHLLAHSMGGAIGLAALLDGLDVQSAAFSAPMWGIHHAPFPAPAVTGIARGAMRLGRGQRPAIRTGGLGTYLLDAPFRGNALTGDPIQWARLVAQAGSWPHLTLGGATYGWIAAAMAECRRLAARPGPAIPALIGLGTGEIVVSPAAIRARAAAWPGAELVCIPGAGHELMFETQPLRDIFRHAVLRLFARGPASGGNGAEAR